MSKRFLKYASIGVINTAIHWAVFFFMISFMGKDQSLSNFVAFCVAVTFSFFANSKITFKAQATSVRYIMYVVFMGAMSIAVGYASDKLSIHPLLTMIIFSAISLVVGYIYSKHIVFKDKK